MKETKNKRKEGRKNERKKEGRMEVLYKDALIMEIL